MSALAPWVYIAALIIIGLCLVLAEAVIPSGGVLGVVALVTIATGVGMGFFQYGVEGGLYSLFAAAAALPAAISLALWVFPRTSLGRRILLGSPTEEDVMPDDEEIVGIRRLVGRVGLAETKMLPSGAVQIDGQVYEAVTNGEPIDAGEPIRVLDVYTNRLVVCRWDEPSDDEPNDSPNVDVDHLAKSIDDLGLDSDPLR